MFGSKRQQLKKVIQSAVTGPNEAPNSTANSSSPGGKAPDHPWLGGIAVGICVLFILIAVFAWAGPWRGAVPKSLNSLNWGFVLFSLALAGFFPITAIVYESSQFAIRRKELEIDLRKLGRESSKDRIDIESCDKFYAPRNYAMHYLPTIMFTILGLILFFHQFTFDPKGWLNNPKTLQAMQYGFVGSYLFAIFLVYRRYTTRDLQPYVYLQCTQTIIAGLGFNYVAFEATNKLFPPVDSGIGAGLVPITAFSFGFFTYVAVRWVSRLAHSALGERQHRADEFPLGLIDGISRMHESRLLDEGIDNLQNLASANIEDLLCHTRYGVEQVVDWIDQAVLYIYLQFSEIESFRHGGVRSISDFQTFWEPFYEKCNKDDGMPKCSPNMPQEVEALRKPYAQQLQSTPERLDMLYRTTQKGPNMFYITHY
jgi:hypothetical protein